MEDRTDIESLLHKLENRFKEKGSLVVAFSGGVDSSLILALAVQALGNDKTLAVIVDDPSLPRRELEQAKKICSKLGAELRVIEHDPFSNPDFASNPSDRCYHCKKGTVGIMRKIQAENCFGAIAMGVTYSDRDQFRPGMLACSEEGIWLPLLEEKITKAAVRKMAKALNLPNWDKPSQACLTSRVPYGEKISGEILRRIEKAENIFWDLEFSQVRVRYHGGLARIEVPREEFTKLFSLSKSEFEGTVYRLRELGFSYVTLDLQGFRSGSMDEVLDKELMAKVIEKLDDSN